ncbi:MAG: acetate/propionate family kinase [Acidimicrobiales bacterium]
MHILVVNAGSSSLKLTVLDDADEVVTAVTLPAPSGRVDEDALRSVVARAGPIGAVGHRVVHGGSYFTEPVLVDSQVVQRLEALSDLAPLHQPKSLRALELVSRLLDGVPAVACFDTAFHSSVPPAAATYAIPEEWRRRWDLRRFGFHGLSHSYASRRAAQLSGRPIGQLRIVSAHLGAGASLAAVQAGRSVDTTMGFTPLEGLVMATRSGSVDPGLLLWLEEHVGMPPSELASTLEHRSGLFGLTGTADMRAVLQAEAAGDPAATLAVAVYLHRLRAGIASMAAAMGGLDVLVFTGGVGERSPGIRWRAAEGLEFLGVKLGLEANEAPGPADRELSATDDRELMSTGSEEGGPDAVRTFVVAAREDLEIARGVREVIGGRW